MKDGSMAIKSEVTVGWVQWNPSTNDLQINDTSPIGRLPVVPAVYTIIEKCTKQTLK